MMRLLVVACLFSSALGGILSANEQAAMASLCDSFPGLSCPANHRSRGDYCSILSAFTKCVSVSSTQDSVQELILEGPTKLSGTIPDNIGGLTTMRKFYARSNTISGTIPASLANTLVVDLNLQDNRLSGTIPAALATRPLISLELDNNHLDGSIPVGIFQSSLLNLDLRGNLLRGSIPPAIKNAPKLNFLKLSDNGFEGTIPSQIGALTNLFELLLDGNQLRGSVPSDIGLLQSLATFTLHENLNIFPNLPTEIGNMHPAQGSYILMGNNVQGTSTFVGTLPTELGRLTGLIQIAIFDFPFLGGTLPTEVGKMSSLHSLWIEGTSISGTIPTELDQVTGLVSLRLRNNLLSGALPTLSHVFVNSAQPRQEYWFSDNYLVGNIPTFGSQVEFQCAGTFMTPASLCPTGKQCANTNQESAQAVDFRGCSSDGFVRGDFFVTPARDESCFSEYLVYAGNQQNPVGTAPLFRVPKNPKFNAKARALAVAVQATVPVLWVYSGSGSALPQSIQIPPLKFSLTSVVCDPTSTPNAATSASPTRPPSESPAPSQGSKAQSGSNGGVIAAAIIVVGVAFVVVGLIFYVRRRRGTGRTQLAKVHPKDMREMADDEDRYPSKKYPKNPNTYV